MPLNKPRRIFRPSLTTGVLRAVLLSVAALAGGGGVVMALSTADLFGHYPTRSGRLTAAPADVAVIDGGTLRLHRQVVRLIGVNPPARGENCGAQGDCGSAAANALADLVRASPVSCSVQSEDALARPLGRCVAGGTELNLAIISGGWGRAEGEISDLREAENVARTRRLGVWRGR